ncbi:MAG: DUF167 domain-containing protein [Burkholderiales bacterium]|nr:MAG: DUF167 domain-containing protein [Burkholderiales bacterium]TAG84439.1 MAG: DUF167 domain-containing protein [Betaproteobacteria bacterium]
MRRIQVKVKPSAKHSKLELQTDASGESIWVAHVKAPPIDGRANEALIGLLASHFSVRKQSVRVVTGQSARLKRIEIADE